MSDTRERLEAMRDRLADLLDGADERTAPALVREYRTTLAALDAMPAAEKKSKVDELRARRAARSPKAPARARSTGS